VQIRDVLWDELQARLQADIFQGILLEIVQLISKDLSEHMAGGSTKVLVAGYRHFWYLITAFLEPCTQIAMPET
jgi:hypothetical protein